MDDGHDDQMAVVTAELEAVRIKAMVLSVAVQTLIERLTFSGVLGRGDLILMREAGLKLASDLGAMLNDPALRAHMMAETDRWWAATEAHAGTAPIVTPALPPAPESPRTRGER